MLLTILFKIEKLSYIIITILRIFLSISNEMAYKKLILMNLESSRGFLYRKKKPSHHRLFLVGASKISIQN